MSRCFPFPPPGYEKKARTDDVDLLAKDKHKEKKPKKEKRDKKKEGKEKKEKERSKDKHREKKDRKEKHKDKNKSKDKKDEKKIEGKPNGNNGEKHPENNQRAEEIKDTKFVEEFNRRIGDEERGRRDQMVENFTASVQRKVEVMDRLGEMDNDSRFEGKENSKDKDGHDKKSDRQRNKDEGKVIGNAVSLSFSGAEQRRVGSMARPMEKGTERKMAGKEKNKGQDGDEKQKDKHKHRDKEKKSKEKTADKEKLKDKIKHENRKEDKVGEIRKDPVITLNIKPIQIPKDSEKSASTEEKFRKRKDCETNGFLHDNDVRPNKLPRPTYSSHPLTGNGRKSELCQTATQFASAMHGGANNLKVDIKEHKINGLIQAQPSSISSTSSFPAVQARENGEVFTEPPHPDSKYLNQILSVPKMEDWSDFDDQEWLFSSDSLQVKKPKMVSSGVGGSPQVWDRALRIDSAEVCALPYVIPY